MYIQEATALPTLPTSSLTRVRKVCSHVKNRFSGLGNRNTRRLAFCEGSEHQCVFGWMGAWSADRGAFLRSWFCGWSVQDDPRWPKAAVAAFPTTRRGRSHGSRNGARNLTLLRQLHPTPRYGLSILETAVLATKNWRRIVDLPDIRGTRVTVPLLSRRPHLTPILTGTDTSLFRP